MNRYCVFDIEADGLLDTVSKIHCLSYQIIENKKVIHRKSITEYNDIKNLFGEDYIFVGHNIIRYDIPVLEKILSVSLKNVSLIDTLGLSWYLFPDLNKHGLEYWGDHIGVKKPEIKDWKDLSLKDYINRCQEDVKINTTIFTSFMDYLLEIYSNENEVHRIIKYLNFKLNSLKEQEYWGITLDDKKASKNLKVLEKEYDKKNNILIEAMPNELGNVVKKRPKNFFKKDGNFSSHAWKYLEELNVRNLPLETKEIKDPPNPGSHSQLKEWLYKLGWEPVTFKESAATGEKVSQISLPFGGGVCDSVKKLYKKEPRLKELENLNVIRHRMGIFKSFLKFNNNGKILSQAHGFTNTLRLTHSNPVVNLPKPGVFFGHEVRECLTVPNKEEYIMFGSDISSLEDKTKQHYIYFYDPEYVKQMMDPKFDPHLDLGKLSGKITQEEIDYYKNYENLPDEKKDKERYKLIKAKRHVAKTTNYSCTYNAFPNKISETAKISLKEATDLFNMFWKRNWAIKEFSSNIEISEIKGQKWVKNPVSNFWMFLKEEKDVFSTINQSTGVFVFDNWIKEIKNLRKDQNQLPIILQYHDEILGYCRKEEKENVENILNEAMDKVNKKLRLNVKISISVDWGYNYSECH